MLHNCRFIICIIWLVHLCLEKLPLLSNSGLSPAESCWSRNNFHLVSVSPQIYNIILYSTVMTSLVFYFYNYRDNHQTVVKKKKAVCRENLHFIHFHSVYSVSNQTLSSDPHMLKTSKWRFDPVRTVNLIIRQDWQPETKMSPDQHQGLLQETH